MLAGKQLRKVFNGTVAVNDLSFTIEEKSITAIIGPNGAGKTTLFNLITGFLGADHGDIYLHDKRLTGTPPHKIAQAGISRTFQDLRLLRQVTVMENLLVAFPNQSGESVWNAIFSGRVRREETANRGVASTLLEFVGLEGKSTEPGENLSYGQQKLLSLACCLAIGGEILLLDEPVAGVHPDMATRILDGVVKLKEQGKTVVFIEHDIEAVKKVADCVLVMDEGKLIASGPTADVLGGKEIVEAYLS